LNATSLRALEFETIRGLLASYAGSARGRARLQALAPSTDAGRVQEALHTAVEAVTLLGVVGRQPYHDLPDVETALVAAKVGGMHLEPTQLRDVASFIEGAAEIARSVAARSEAPRLAARASRVADAGDVAQAIRRAILPSGEVADQASPRLAETRRAILRMRAQLHSLMESFLRGKDADRLLQDKLVTTRNDRYVLLLKAEQRGQLPGIIHGSSGSGASYFVEPLPAVELNNDVVALVEAERAEVIRILQELTAMVGARSDELLGAVEILAELDAAQATALLAKQLDARAPEISDRGLELRDARHPLLIAKLGERLGTARRPSKDAVPVTIKVGFGAPVLVISGPNTGGKTVALKTVGLLAMMAQSGLLIPVGEGSVLPVFHRIFADIGDDQSIAENLSTFSAHLRAIAAMTADLEPPALVLLDEVGAGTDPTEGGALGVAIVDGFRRRGAFVVATTHHGLMKGYAQATPGVACASFGYDERSFEPTYRLQLGAPGRSLALEMAARLALPSDMLDDARARRDTKQAQAEELLKTLEQKQAQLDREEQRVAALRQEAEQAAARAGEAERAIAARKKTELESFARELRRRADEASRRAADAIREAVQKLETTRRSTPSAAAQARSQTIGEIQKAHEQVLRDPEVLGVLSEAPPVSQTVALGSRVRVATLGVVGEVVELHGERELELAVGGKRLRVPRSAVTGVVGTGSGQPAARVGSFKAPPRAAAVPAEINLVGLTVDEALPRVDKLLDDAALSERREIRVIHGFGQGKLRRAVASLLEGHPHVASFRPGGPREGGAGATVVELKE
jgi:DNA mismatch repair protein MutS2